jgi:hypothetical protein
MNGQELPAGKEINQIASMNLNDVCDLRAPLCENDNR